jgi:mono/diheme cytochrome c family protein
MMFELSKAAPEARVRTNPYEGNQDACRAGWKLFQRHCSVCHGKDAKGGNDAPDLQSPPIRDAAPGTLFWFLKNGDLKKGMPSWARLPEQQLWQIVSYLKSKN